ncbi:hypothetical protein RsS62_32160 [Rhizobium dioscoreae]|nr:hypothetical protein RsS62_32160 [Rhizobium dioscoreae]
MRRHLLGIGLIDFEHRERRVGQIILSCAASADYLSGFNYIPESKSSLTSPFEINLDDKQNQFDKQ